MYVNTRMPRTVGFDAPAATPDGGLPDEPKMAWPPTHCAEAYEHMQLYSAWYAGDPEHLAMVYGGTYGSEHPFFNRPSQYRGGVVGTVARWFWGAPTPAGEKRAKLHVPIAADIAALSADLLFSEPPDLTVEHDASQKRLDEILEATMVDARLLEAAEVQSPLGGVFLVVSWDDQFAPHPFLRAVHADAAIPEFRWGRLSAVTFWKVVRDDAGKVWRHLERHEPGAILHGLYQGSTDQLGHRVPLTEHPATARLPERVAGIPNRLTAAYVPNLLPNRLDRNSPQGRSDYSPGILTLMDALDETYSSWMRDLRLAKHRLVVPRAYLQGQGPGKGARFEAEREIFEALDALPDARGAMQLTPTNFPIRVAEHQQTADNLVAQIIGRAGYSAQSIGEQGEVAITATEVEARERRSFMTRRKKLRYWRPAIAEIIETMLMVDATMFGSKITPGPVTVEFGDAVAETPEGLARTLQLLETAAAISTEQKVRMRNPDWEDDEVDAEVEKILAESGKGGATMANPDEITGAGADGSVIGGGPTPPGQDPASSAGGQVNDAPATPPAKGRGPRRGGRSGRARTRQQAA